MQCKRGAKVTYHCLAYLDSDPVHYVLKCSPSSPVFYVVSLCQEIFILLLNYTTPPSPPSQNIT